jgi:hypothetical protein
MDSPTSEFIVDFLVARITELHIMPSVESDRTSTVALLIRELTAGKPYVFMLMPFGSQWPLFERVKAVVHECVGLNCIRADDIPGAGFDLLEKIHVAIEKSELVIAEISERNPNVFYELGYAVGIKKPVLLLAQRAADIPSDLRGRELILYSLDRSGSEAFDKELRNHLQRRMNSQVALLRDMLEAERPLPSFIVASPKYPHKSSQIPGQPRDRRTFGDNLGVLGLLSAFGSVFGETGGVELVSGQYCSEDLPERDQNLYLIGSPKVNPRVAEVMSMIQSNQPVWRFGAAAGHEPKGDYPMVLYRQGPGGDLAKTGKTAQRSAGEVYIEDYGIILRGPHPKHPGRSLMVMAGAHSLGTGAACIAATRSQHIRDIKSKGIDIAERHNAFWVLVKGVESSRDGLLDIEGVSIVEVGQYPQASQHPAR